MISFAFTITHHHRMPYLESFAYIKEARPNSVTLFLFFSNILLYFFRNRNLMLRLIALYSILLIKLYLIQVLK